MGANEFVKEFGWDAIKDMLQKYPKSTHVTNDAGMFINSSEYKKHAPWFADDVDKMVSFNDLKRLVKSWELVEKHGGIDSLNDLFYVHGMNSARVMKVGNLTYADAMQAIADVESCND